mmetsp:Transcript_42834/g.80355  ORF Transcript_42834/g.80355 Transcript_42834/m.80355 type:complete len:636 (+) Transcript_42834:78-1985(+)
MQMIFTICAASIPMLLGSSVECPKSLIQDGRSIHSRIMVNESTNLSVSLQKQEPADLLRKPKSSKLFNTEYTDTIGVDIEMLWTRLSNQNPDLSRITKYAVGLLLCLAVLDISVHLADQCMKDPQRRLLFDHFVDALVACLGMITCFIWYSLIQEFILQHEYPTGDMFPDASFLILSDKIFALVVSSISILLARTPFQWQAGKWVVGPGTLDWLAAYCIDKSTSYLAYTVVTVFKCSRVVPIMVCNTFINGEKQGIKDYGLAVLICAGVAGFSYLNAGDNSPPKEDSGFIGIKLIVAGLMASALTTTSEKWIFRKYDGFSHMSMMFSINLVGGVIGFIVCKFTLGFAVLFAFLKNNPSAVGHILMLGTACTLGCYLVFYVLDHHGPVTVAIAILVKQILTIYMSAVLYDHEITPAASVCAMLTFLAVGARPLMKYFEQDAVVVPLKVGHLRNGLNITASIRKQLGHDVKVSATVLVAAARLQASFKANSEKTIGDANSDMREYSMAFAMIAGNGNGFIDTAGLGKVLNALGQSHSEEEVQAMLGEFQAEKDSLSFEQFVSMMKQLKRKQNEDLLEAFKVFDEDNSGSISKEELIHIFANLGEKVSDADVGKMIACYDLDKDGKIDFSEFVKMMDK